MVSVLPDLDRLQAAASQTTLDLGHLRIDKWKADAESKRQAQANADSVQRNLTSALPGLIDAVRSAPQDLTAEFKLYRNLNALYDVLVSLTEATGAFGPRSDYEALAQQLETIDSVRRNLGDALERLTSSTQSELNQLTDPGSRLPADCGGDGNASQESCRGRHRAAKEDRAQKEKASSIQRHGLLARPIRNPRTVPALATSPPKP